MFRLNKELGFFIIGGLISTLLSFVAFNLLATFFFSSMVVRYVAYFVGASVGYFFNSTFTFVNRRSCVKFLKYQIGYLPSYVVGEVATYKALPFLNGNLQFACVLIITAVSNFLILKYFVFNNS